MLWTNLLDVYAGREMEHYAKLSLPLTEEKERESGGPHEVHATASEVHQRHVECLDSTCDAFV